MTTNNDSKMTKGEREEFMRFMRRREKTLKSAAKQRSTDMLADFDSQLAAQFSFDDDPVWDQAMKLAQVEVDKAQEQVAARCAELGIPRQFAPRLHLSWSVRGYGNAVKERRDELQQAARSQIQAIEQRAAVRIELLSLNAEMEIAKAGLTSVAAHAFVATLPSIEDLMPALSYSEIAGEANPSVVEQLITPNPLRQRSGRDEPRALGDEGGVDNEGAA